MTRRAAVLLAGPGGFLVSLVSGELLDAWHRIGTEDAHRNAIDPGAVCSPEERKRLVPRKVESAR